MIQPLCPFRRVRRAAGSAAAAFAVMIARIVIVAPRPIPLAGDKMTDCSSPLAIDL